MKKLILVLFILTATGCSEDPDRTGEIKKEVTYSHYCSNDTKEARSDFILACLKNANPVSDEEPEDWILQG